MPAAHRNHPSKIVIGQRLPEYTAPEVDVGDGIAIRPMTERALVGIQA
jgi:hypothetical protein